MSSIGLVLGGGGVTGASFHLGALLSLRMATGWNPNDAEVVVGTSSGAVIAAMLRHDRLDLGFFVGDSPGREELADDLSERIYTKSRPRGVFRWIRHGVLPGLRRPGLQLVLGSPGRYSTEGIVGWLDDHLGDAAHGWPEKPTIVVALELEARRRVAFGTESSPDTTLARAVAASSAVPMVFEPVSVNGRRYVDGGLASGTSADLVLGAEPPLDLVIVIAPMAPTERREDARFYEGIVDRLGGNALAAELGLIAAAWPDTEVLVLRPDRSVLEAARPNPMKTDAAVPAFLRTLRSMRSHLAAPEVWPVLERHLVTPGHR